MTITFASTNDEIKNDEKNGSIEFLTFLLNREIYGIDIQNVQEIHGYDQLTLIKKKSFFQLDGINLRGKLIPILDLRNISEHLELENTATTNVIIVNTNNTTIGIVVDGVSDVISTQKNQIRIVTDMKASIGVQSTSGQLYIDENVIMLIDIEKLIVNQPC